MVQLKVLIQVIAVIILLNRREYVQKRDEFRYVLNKKSINDTLFLAQKDYKIVYRNVYCLDLKIIDSIKIDSLKKNKNPIIKINLDDSFIVAKGNNIFSSSVPENCDYFYPLDMENKLIMVNGIINLRKIN